MSKAEIADNKWETQASKPEIATPGAAAQIGLMGFFGLFFVFIILGSVIGVFTDPEEGESLESKFEHMNDEKAPEAAPAEK